MINQALRVPRLLSLADAASALGVSRRTAERLIERGVLRRVVIPTSRRLLIDLRDIEALVLAGKGRPSTKT